MRDDLTQDQKTKLDENLGKLNEAQAVIDKAEAAVDAAYLRFEELKECRERIFSEGGALS